MRGKVLKNGQVEVNNGRVGRVGRDFPIFKLKSGIPEIILNKEKTLPTLPTLPTEPPKNAGRSNPGPDLDEWRKINIPWWQRILKESIEAGDKGREKYARWMLQTVLEVEVL